MNPEYENSLQRIRDFWKFAAENIHLINPNDIAKDSKLLGQITARGEDPKSHYLNLSVSTLVYIDLTEKISAIDPEVEIFVGNDFINFKDYPLGDSTPSKLKTSMEKLVVVRKCIEFSVSGNKDKFLLLDIIRSISDQYKLPDNWHVTIYKQRQHEFRDHNLIPFVSPSVQMAIGVSSLQFVLKPLNEFSSDVIAIIEPNLSIPLDQQFDLMIILEDEFAQSLKTQNDVYNLRNCIFVWLETIIGEYATSMNITRLTVIPELGLTEMIKNMGPDGLLLRNSLKNGVYLIPELTEKISANECELCHIRETHIPLREHKDNGTFEFDDFQHAHPHIREGYYCNFCFDMLSRLEPQ